MRKREMSLLINARMTWTWVWGRWQGLRENERQEQRVIMKRFASHRVSRALKGTKYSSISHPPWSVYQFNSTSRRKQVTKCTSQMRTWGRTGQATVSEPLNKSGSHSKKNLNLIQQELGSLSELNQSLLTSWLGTATSKTTWKKTGNSTLITASKGLSSLARSMPVLLSWRAPEAALGTLSNGLRSFPAAAIRWHDTHYSGSNTILSWYSEVVRKTFSFHYP